MLNICADCTTSYAADLALCPHCGSERRTQADTDPYRGGTEPMSPKITRQRGPSIAVSGGWSAGEQEETPAGGQAEPDGAGADAARPPADTVDDSETAAEPTNADIRAWAQANDVDVSASGPISKAVREAYAAAHAG